MKIKFISDVSMLKKTLIVMVILLIIGVVGLFIYVGKYSSYVKVSATIVDVKLKYDNLEHDNQNRNRYIEYKYTFEGKKYLAERLVFFGSRRNIGKEVTIKVNPKKPQEIANYTFIKSFVVMDVFLAILSFWVIKHLYRCKKI